MLEENSDYLSKQLITYLGNKRALLPQIGAAVNLVRRRLGKTHLRIFDVFAGSGIVSRYLKAHAKYLVANDIESYAAVIGRCYLRNKSTLDMGHLDEVVRELNAEVMTERFGAGFIEELYAPHDEAHISTQDRVFYTRDNARRLDNYRRLLESIPVDLRDMILGPLLSEASIHVNTAGVFKGFYKDRITKVGRFGGSGSNALPRIKGKIVLEVPVLSNFECDVNVLQGDATVVALGTPNLDLAYLDPPYNQHPYGSNYFMLNLLVHYERPQDISTVSGIPQDWHRSGYNVRSRFFSLFRELLQSIDASFLLVSFNSEGFITPDAMMKLLNTIGAVEVFETPYNAFRGSRNLSNRDTRITEFLFLVQR